MKKIIMLVFSLMLVFGCSNKGDGAKVNTREELVRSSTLEKIIKSGKVRVGLEAGYLPFEFMSDKGEIIGFDVDLAQRMAKELEVELEIVNTSWDGIIPGLQTGKYDIIMSGMTRTLKRALSVNFTDPYYQTGQVIMVRKGETRIKSYTDLNTKDMKVAVKLGTTSDFAAEKILKKAVRVAYKTETDGAMALRTNKVDAFIYDQPYIEDYIEKYPEVEMLSELFTKEYFGFAVKKGDEDFLNWLNLYLAEIKADGTYEGLYTKWFIDKEYKNK